MKSKSLKRKNQLNDLKVILANETTKILHGKNKIFESRKNSKRYF